MPRERVYITRPIQQEAIELLKEHFDVTMNPEDRVVERDVLLKEVENVDALLCLINDRTRRLLPGKRARIIANYGVGYNNIDVTRPPKGIIVTNTPAFLPMQPQTLLGLLPTAARRIVESDKNPQGRASMKAGPLHCFWAQRGGQNPRDNIWKDWQAAAKRSIGFDMKVLYHNRKRDPTWKES